MRIAIPHKTTRAKARKIVEDKLRNLEQHYGHYAKEVEHEWQGDTLHVGFNAKGIKAKGTVEITETELIVDGKLPLLAKPFESRIRSTVEREAESMFRTA